MKMKKILIMSTAGIGIFIILVAVIFFVLSKFNPNTDPSTVPEQVQDPNRRSVDELLVEMKNKQLDSLKTVITNLNNEIFLKDAAGDSLKDVIAQQSKMTTAFQKQVEDLNQKLLEAEKKQGQVKDLAKTFESMKVDEIRPILGKVDNGTVLAIYRNMGSRSKKMILMALSSERAAEITKQLAGSQSEG